MHLQSPTGPNSMLSLILQLIGSLIYEVHMICGKVDHTFDLYFKLLL